MSTAKADLYKGSLGVEVDSLPPLAGYCFPTLDVLPGLRGKPWNDVALALVTTLRPSAIRATRGETKSNSRAWRVTVYLASDDRTIVSIEQEVTAFGFAGNGAALRAYYEADGLSGGGS